MMNNLMLVGRLVGDPVVKEVGDEKRLSNITLAIPRSYKNEEGIYETDFVDVTLWNGIAENTAQYCKKGDIVGVRGRLQVSSYEIEGEKQSKLQVIAEKISFLSKTRDVKENTMEDR